MKRKIIGLVAVLMSVLMLASCGLVESISIAADGKINNLTSKIILTEDEYVEASKSEGASEYLSMYRFNKETIDGKTYYTYTIKQSPEGAKISELDKSLRTGQAGELQCGNASAKEIWFKYNASYVKNYMTEMGLGNKSISYQVSITFAYEIAKTNGTLSNDKKTVTFTASTSNSIFYAATTASTAAWAKAADPYVAIKAVADTFMNPLKIKASLSAKTSAKISWTKNKNAKSYKVYKTLNGTKWTLVKTTTGSSYVCKGLKKNKITYFKVLAVNSNWTSGDSNYAYAYPLGGKAYIDSAKVKSKTVTLKMYSEGDATGFIVYRSAKKNGKYKKVATIKKNSYTQKKLKKGTYYYKVKAYQNAGKEKNYSSLSAAKKVVIKK